MPLYLETFATDPRSGNYLFTPISLITGCPSPDMTSMKLSTTLLVSNTRAIPKLCERACDLKEEFYLINPHPRRTADYH